MIAVDANIIMELLENRRYVQPVRDALRNFAKTGEIAGVSALSVSNVFYLAESHKLTLKDVEKVIRSFKVFDVVSADVDWAFAHYKGKDFEDALQVASALREDCTVFLTLDTALAKKYSKFLKIQLVEG